MRYVSKSHEETKDVARIFLDSIYPIGKSSVVVTLQGELGAGKTTFVQAVGEILGVGDTMQSPTFVIEKIYPIDYHGFKNLIHIDVYRLEKESELLHLGWNEIIKEPENLIFLEWPERVAGLIPPGAKRISFRIVDEHTREIDI